MPIGYLALRGVSIGPEQLGALIFTERSARLATTTLLLAVVVGAGTVALGSGLAFLVTRTDLPLRRVLAVAATIPLAIPSYVAAFTWLTVGSLWGSVTQFEGFWSAVVVLTLYSSPYVFLPVAAALAHSDASQEEVARSLGMRPLQVWRRVTMPQVRPALAGGLLLVVLYVLSDFGAVSIVRVDTFTRAIFTAFSAGFDRDNALALSSLLLLLTMVALTADALVRGRRSRLDTVHISASRTLIPLGRWRWPLWLLAFSVPAVSLGVPLAGTAHWFVTGTSRPESWERVVSAVAGSLSVSTAGAILTVALALPLGLLAAWSPGRLARWTERAAYLGYSLPGVIVGLSLVSFGVHLARPLYQTTWLLALGYATLFIPLALASVATAAARCGPGLRDVAASMGAGPARRFWRVTLPLLLPGIGAGAALAFLACMKELPATLMLRPTGLHTLATELWQATANQRYAEAAPFAVLLVLLSAIPMWVVLRRAGIVNSGKGAQ